MVPETRSSWLECHSLWQLYKPALGRRQMWSASTIAIKLFEIVYGIVQLKYVHNIYNSLMYFLHLFNRQCENLRNATHKHHVLTLVENLRSIISINPQIQRISNMIPNQNTPDMLSVKQFHH
jgi:hypothetical protein